ncbi:nitric-oxide reductase large subunit [Permianibacter sp. IMCC34836]|uniref:nitric-oxide reductase large subunit n=1 Tax=Permianibacter fluminis TaxID=2738515 RepID=UPI0015558CA6|nr:nitric-oxide reductase large subunit [Permianibacter fluminis]NQD37899.1 nitric-oxide reductase large subunit [Permianibacter fluminis]
MQNIKRLGLYFALMFLVSFGVLIYLGGEIYREAPPMPERVVTSAGETLYTRADLDLGRQVWQTVGGQQLGSIWGHGGYVAPDWSADWLHREASTLLDIWAKAEYGSDFGALGVGAQGALKARLVEAMRTNTYDATNGTITVSAERAQAIKLVAAHYVDLFGDAPALEKLREQYAIRNNAVPNADYRQAMTAFFFWTAWSAGTNRPNDDISYTSNWPHEPLIDNKPSSGTVLWSIGSVILLIAGVGLLVWHHGKSKHEESLTVPSSDPLGGLKPTASMRATGKYFLTVAALFVGQITLGGITAHYAVEGHSFYGFQLADILPYSLVRTWHTQLGIFWIATAWLATGLYIAPALSGHEPKYQKWGVNALFGALLIVVVGSFVGEWFGVMQKLHPDMNFWFGHQGYEYVDLGRFWQILLFIGLMFWLFLVGRALWPALKEKSEQRPLIGLVFLSTVAIGLFYGAGLTWGKHTHLAMIEYFRWWVVHLWVEGFFEVFATAVISLIFVRLGLVRAKTASSAVLFATTVFLFGGILGTLHHLYFTGAPTSIIAVGAMFSALEVVPLALVGFEAYETYRHTQAAPWVAKYRWPILFFVAVAFWNLVGAGLLGFFINPPISLYYIQGLNSTAAHGHAALFGVYGMLGIGLMLFCLRGLAGSIEWNEKALKACFWLLNLGLVGMVFMTLVPAGIYQAVASIDVGYWYARSPDVIHSSVMETLVWLRVPGDIVFSLGAFTLIAFVASLAWKARARRAAAVASAGAALGNES